MFLRLFSVTDNIPTADENKLNLNSYRVRNFVTSENSWK